MPFQKGHKLAKGRPVGAINRSTEMMKLSIARATNKVLDDLPAIMEDIIKQDPKAAVDLAIKLLEFNLPKQSRVEMKAEIEQKIQQINLNILDGTKHNNIKDI
jgi:outer membrane protein assembly factor BamD (BamD/ComL family)